MEDIYDKARRLKDYKGFIIEKTWRVDPKTKRVMKRTVYYTAFYEDGIGLFDAYRTLEELKKALDKSVMGEKLKNTKVKPSTIREGRK